MEKETTSTVYTFASPITATPYDSYEELQDIPEVAKIALAGKTDDTELADYICDNKGLKAKLAGTRLRHGIMTLRMYENKLCICTAFSSDQRLTAEQISELQEFVAGQYSDGGGAGWLQQFNDDFALRFEVDYRTMDISVTSE